VAISLTQQPMKTVPPLTLYIQSVHAHVTNLAYAKCM